MHEQQEGCIAYGLSDPANYSSLLANKYNTHMAHALSSLLCSALSTYHCFDLPQSSSHCSSACLPAPMYLQGLYTWHANVTDQVGRQLACFTMKIKI